MSLTKVIAELCDAGLWIVAAIFVGVGTASTTSSSSLGIIAALLVFVIRKLDRLETAIAKTGETPKGD